ncbi:MAG: IS630 transposase-related protein [Psychromonas sp.]
MTPCTTRQKPATKLDMDKLKQDVEDYPDDYQWERAKRLNVGKPAIHYGFKRLNISYKKALTPPKADQKARSNSSEKYENMKKKVEK